MINLGLRRDAYALVSITLSKYVENSIRQQLQLSLLLAFNLFGGQIGLGPILEYMHTKNS